MSSWLGQFHDFTEKYDPLGHALVNGAWKSSTKLVNETSKGLSKLGEKAGVSTAFPDYWANQSQKDKDSFSRWGENTIGSAAALYGGASALGGSGSGAAAGGAGEGALGASGVPWAGGVDAGASGLGYAEAGGGFVGNAGAGGGTGSFFGSSGGGLGSMNQKMPFQMGGSTKQADSSALQRQLALAEMMRKQREQNEASAELPGWVEMA